MTPPVPPSIAIIDYGMGNRRSVEKAFAHVGADAGVTADPDRLMAADALVLPGVGAFPKGMANLRERHLDTLIRERVGDGVPLLGICLGMQLLFDSSEELGETDGLGLISGRVRRLHAGALRLPHIGWNEVRFERPSPITAELPDGGVPFYHVHSYVACPDRESEIVGTSEYGEPFATIVGRENVYGVQFHPEKSSRDGLRLLESFCALALSRGRAAA